MGRRNKILIGIFFAVILVLATFVALFWYTGGKSLVYVYRHYLTQDIANREYSYPDFRDRGPQTMLHGYYAGADSSAFYMWTLSGLRRFRHQPNMSVYYYVDPCGLIKQLEEGSKEKDAGGQNRLDEGLTFDFDIWRGSMKRGDYVWVKRVGEGVKPTN